MNIDPLPDDAHAYVIKCAREMLNDLNNNLQQFPDLHPAHIVLNTLQAAMQILLANCDLNEMQALEFLAGFQSTFRNFFIMNKIIKEE